MLNRTYYHNVWHAFLSQHPLVPPGWKNPPKDTAFSLNFEGFLLDYYFIFMT